MTLFTAFHPSTGFTPVGDCICEECGKNDLLPEQMSDNHRFGYPICADCAEMILSGYVHCNECRGKPAGIRRYDAVRGESYTDWCVRCDGRRKVFVGVLPHLREEARAAQ